MSFDEFESSYCLGLVGAGDLEAPRTNILVRLHKHCDTIGVFVLQLSTVKISLTSMEQPISEPRLRALFMILKRFGGAFSKEYTSAIPPVKSSKPSMVFPPERAS